MGRILQMEGFRMLKSPVTWLSLLAFSGLYGFASLVMGLLCGDSSLARELQTGLGMDGEMAVQDFGEILSMTLQGNTTLLFVSLWTALFATGHRASGFCKTLCGWAGSGQLALSYGLYSILYSSLLLLLALPELRVVLCVTHRTVTPPDFLPLLCYGAVYTLQNAAFGAFCVAVAGCFRNRIAAVCIPLVYCVAGGSVLYYAVDHLLLPALGKEDVLLEHYLPWGNIRTLSLYSPPERFPTAACSAAVLWILCICLGAWLDGKKEI